MPTQIHTTGNHTIDTETAQLALHLRDAGMTEQRATEEAQRIRDTFLWGAAEQLVKTRGYPTLTTPEAMVTALRRLTGNFGCQCTGHDGCPAPSSCGTPNGCLCGA